MNGRTYPNTPSSPRTAYNAPPSEEDQGRFFTVPIKFAIARYVKAKFRIRGDWILISEVEFESSEKARLFIFLT